MNDCEKFAGRLLAKLKRQQRKPKPRGKRPRGGEPVEPLPPGPLPTLEGGAAAALDFDEPNR